MMKDKIDAIILAGGKTSPEWKAVCGYDERALVPFQCKPLVDWVINALEASQYINKIVVVGSSPECKNITQVPAGETFLKSLVNGMKEVETEYFLQVTADIPFLTTEAVDDFIQKASMEELDIAYAIVPKAACDNRFPGVKRTYVKVAEGVFTGGNIGLVNRVYLQKRLPYIEKAYGARKKPLKLASMLGFDTLIRLLLGQQLPKCFTIAFAEKKVGRMLGGKLKAVITEYAEIGADIDSLEHHKQLEAFSIHSKI